MRTEDAADVSAKLRRTLLAFFFVASTAGAAAGDGAYRDRSAARATGSEPYDAQQFTDVPSPGCAAVQLPAIIREKIAVVMRFKAAASGNPPLKIQERPDYDLGRPPVEVGASAKTSSTNKPGGSMAGEIDKTKGRIKKAVGELTGNQKMKNEGMIDKAAGAVKSGVEKVKKALQGKRSR